MKEENKFKTIAEFEKLTENEAKKVFHELCQLNDNQNQIDLNFIRRLLSLNNNNYSEIFLKFITQYKLIESMKEDKFDREYLHNRILNEEEFVNFITGKDTKELIFDDNTDLSQKRFKIEDYAKLYELIGGNQKGISKAALQRNIQEILKLINDGDGDEDVSDLAEKETNEIIELLSSNGNNLSPDDFINIMTSNTSLPDNIEDIL